VETPGRPATSARPNNKNPKPDSINRRKKAVRWIQTQAPSIWYDAVAAPKMNSEGKTRPGSR